MSGEDSSKSKESYENNNVKNEKIFDENSGNNLEKFTDKNCKDLNAIQNLNGLANDYNESSYNNLIKTHRNPFSKNSKSNLLSNVAVLLIFLNFYFNFKN